jgi:hypothetical protein
MSRTLISAAAAAILLGSTALASAQTPADPLGNGYTYYGYNYYVPGVGITIGAAPYVYAPGYYDYAPGYYDYAPGYYGWGYNGWDRDRGWWGRQ